MKRRDFSTTISVNQSPQQAFTAINNVYGWWSGEIEGHTDKLGAEFTCRYKDLNSGVAPYEDLSNLAIIEQPLAVNFFGMYKVSRAFLPLLKRSKGPIINNLSLVALAPFPLTSSYSISKAAAHSMTQSLRTLVANPGVTVHGVLPGPTDTDMTRAFEIPKASPESVAKGVFDGLANKEEVIFPDPMSRAIADGWRNGVAKEIEPQYASFVPETVAL
jgi:short-subunit dehydrogenase